MIQSMATDIMTMRDVSGISEIFDASAQDPKQLVGTAQLALAGTQNALAPLIKAFVWILEKTAVDVSLKLQMLAKHGKISGYAPALGSKIAKIIEIGSEISYAHLGIKIESLPTEEQKQRIMQMVQLSLESVNDPTKGGIDFSDALIIGRMLDDGKNKLAEAYIAYKIRKFKEETQATADRNVKLQGQQQQQLEVVKAQAEKANADAKLQREIVLDNAKTENKLRIIEKEFEYAKALHASQTFDKVAENKLTSHVV